MSGQYVDMAGFQLTCSAATIQTGILIFLPTLCLGAYGPGETPVPIPNTAVKLGRVDGSVAYVMQE